ncbi:4277_t:CDS:2, partial [Acaulospora colombiana]
LAAEIYLKDVGRSKLAVINANLKSINNQVSLLSRNYGESLKPTYLLGRINMFELMNQLTQQIYGSRVLLEEDINNSTSTIYIESPRVVIKLSSNNINVETKDNETRKIVQEILFKQLMHIFLYLAPVYFVYLLRHYCFQRIVGTAAKKLGWRLNELALSSITRGLVGDTNYAILPQIQANHTFAVTLVFQADAQERELSQLIYEALAPSIRLELLPKSTIDIYITILENDGTASCLAAAVTCASVAVADAGIEMLDLSYINGEIYMDCDLIEEQHESGSLVISYMPSLKEVTHILQSGEADSTLITQVKFCA